MNTTMQTVGRIVACLLAGTLLFGLLTALQIPPALLSADSIVTGAEPEKTEQQQLYEELFDPHSTVQIEIDIANEKIADIQREYEYYNQNDAKSTVYRKADSVTFIINGRKYVLEEVGVRMKGAKSRCNFYNDILGIYNLLNLRISFNQTFDDASDYGLDTRIWSSKEERDKRRHRTFATLYDMELKWNQSADNTYVRNGYVHEVFRAYGIPAQQCCLTTLSMGGCRMGIYRLFEPVDETFIRRYFPEADWGGDLYKAKGTEKTLATFRSYCTYGVTKKTKGSFTIST